MELLIKIPDAIEPLERGSRFDLPLIEMLEPIGGDIVDSGTFLDGQQVTCCSISVVVPNEDTIAQVISILIAGRAIAGTTISKESPTEGWEVIWISE